MGVLLLTSGCTCAVHKGRAQAEGAGLGASWSWQVAHQEAGQKLSTRGGLWRGGGAQGHRFSSHCQTGTKKTKQVTTSLSTKVGVLIHIKLEKGSRVNVHIFSIKMEKESLRIWESSITVSLKDFQGVLFWLCD